MNCNAFKYCSVFLFALLYFVQLCSSQSNAKIRFTTINTDNGLSSNTVNAIAKDNLGFIWIATDDGLCRYEGSGEVKVYSKDSPKIEGGLESSNIRSLYLDSRQNLWIGTRLGGLTKYHQPSETWTTYRHDKNDPTTISNDEILTITEDRIGQVWVGTEDGLNVYHQDTDSFTSFKMNIDDPNALQGRAVLSIMEDDRGWLWLGTWDGGLHLMIPSNDGAIGRSVFRNFLPGESQDARHIWKIYQDSDQRYWVGSRGAGLFLMDLPSKAHNKSIEEDWKPDFQGYVYDKTNKGIANDNLQDIFEDSRGDLWIATVNGLNRVLATNIKEAISSKGQKQKPAFTFHKYQFDSRDQVSLANNDVITIFEDSQGIVWLGTYSGVSQYNWFTNQFDVHEFFEDISKTPNSQNLYIDPQGMAWIGNGENGLLKYDFDKEMPIKNVKANEPFASDYICTLFSPDDRHLYLGTLDGVSVLDMKTNAVRNFSLPEKYKNYFSRSIFKDQQGRIWLGTEFGLFVIFEKDGTCLPLFNDPRNPNSLSDNAVNQVYEDSKGGIWITTFKGLNRIKKASSNNEFSFERFMHDVDFPETSIPSNRHVALEEIDGVLYIGSNSGLSGYDLEKEVFTNYSKNDNKHSVQSIEKTVDGNLWASTTEGIIFFNTTTKTFNQYEKGDGLGDLIYQKGSSYSDKKGCFYFGSRRGITKFDPQNIIRNKVPPPVYITDVRKMSPRGEELGNAIYSKEILLRYNDYYLSLDYVALNYNRAEKNKYAFMLEGFEENWNYNKNKSPAIYTNLAHGTYYFRVMASNNDGVWNEEGAAIKVTKLPAVWETWWFKIGGLLFGLFGLWIGVKYYTSSIHERNAILQKYNNDLNIEISRRKMIEEELQKRERNLKISNEELQRSNKDLEQFAYIASHDLQEPLRMVGSFVELLGRRYKEHFDDEAFQYIAFAVDGVKRMSAQIHSILTFSKVGSREIVFDWTDLNGILLKKVHDLSQKVEEKNVRLNIGKLPEIYCEETQIGMVFHNLISNAIKFNKNKRPLITVACDDIASDEVWQFSVKDNGIGIAPEFQQIIFDIFRRLHNRRDYEGTGIGLALCQKIIHRHQGKIWLDSVKGEGTTFYFTISKKLMEFGNELDKIKQEKLKQELFN